MRLILSAEQALEAASLEDVWLLFTSSGTFNSAPYLSRGYSKLDAYVVGGGGPGGYGRDSSDTVHAGGGGGGGGSGGLSLFKDRYLAAYDGIQAFTVGAGGIADYLGGSRPGGTSIFDDLKAYGGASGGLGSHGTNTTNGYGGGGGGGAGFTGPGVHGGNGTGAGANGGGPGPYTLTEANTGEDGYGGIGAGSSGHNAARGHNGPIQYLTGEIRAGGGGGGGGGHATFSPSAEGAGAGHGLGGESWPPYNVDGAEDEVVGGGGGGGAGGHNLAVYTPFPNLHGHVEPIQANFRRLIGVGAGGHGGAGAKDPLTDNDITLQPEQGYPGLIVLRLHTS